MGRSGRHLRAGGPVVTVFSWRTAASLTAAGGLLLGVGAWLTKTTPEEG